LTEVIPRPKFDFKRPSAASGAGVTTSTLLAGDPRDAGTYVLSVAANLNIPIIELLSSAPTDALYLIRDMIDRILATREDARK